MVGSNSPITPFRQFKHALDSSYMTYMSSPIKICTPQYNAKYRNRYLATKDIPIRPVLRSRCCNQVALENQIFLI